MAGKVKKMLDEIIARKSNGNTTLMYSTKTKLILKGVNPDRYTASSEDDPATVQKVMALAREMGVNL